MAAPIDTDHPIRQARIALKLSQEAFGDSIGLPQLQVSRLEKGLVSLDLAVAARIVKLCRTHGVDRRLEDFIPAETAAAGEAA